jgi:hypothetical protein
MKAEEEEVDIVGVARDPHDQRHAQAAAGSPREFDEDLLWADEEPDDDVSDFHLEIVMTADDQGDIG